MENHAYTNSLIHESSPYLLQHAHNPVNWYPWNDETLALAKKENKLLLISIGYSACHWCHVMEREVFENRELAEIMNKHFINVKVDREERPDIDHIYMTAVQLMTGHGGWPLNCFALPNGKPIYGGTYFPPARWENVLKSLIDLRKNDYDKMVEYAEKLTEGVQYTELVKLKTNVNTGNREILKKCVEQWAEKFDDTEGGPLKAPKFPLPNNYSFLMRYSALSGDKRVKDHVVLTLDKMAKGGIFDQLGGGFARYSTDIEWKVPHFEKMLYDNAQLVSLYAEAWTFTKDPLYKETAEKTIAFIERELTSAEGFFFSALDADSEGEEGKYYVWKYEELKSLLTPSELTAIEAFYQVNGKGYWEHGNNILVRVEDTGKVLDQIGFTEKELYDHLNSASEKMLSERGKRVRPGLDDKILSSWNFMMISAYADAGRAFDHPAYITKAEEALSGLLKKVNPHEGQIFHSYKNDRASIPGFLEDHAFCLEAHVKLFLATGKEKYLEDSLKLLQVTDDLFLDKFTGFYFFTRGAAPGLITRKTELSDNVIPATNSVMANLLFDLGKITGRRELTERSLSMLAQMTDDTEAYGSGYSNWACLMLKVHYPFFEFAITGPAAREMAQKLSPAYLPNALVAFSDRESDLSIFRGRHSNTETRIFVCRNNSCLAPVFSTEEALKIVEEAS